MMARMIGFPSARDWVFSAKVFVAAMLALYIALAFALPRPYWAMATVYLVSHPLTGATRSKGAYRVVGTLLGAVAAVILVPPLVDAPALLMGAIAFWVGALLYLSLMERSPRSYVFLLAAYTLPIVALPSVNDPMQIFDLAVARVEEICIGIVCASVIGSLVFPARVASALNAQTTVWLADASRWASAMLTGAPGDMQQHDSRYKLAADIRQLDTLITHLQYDADTAMAVRCARVLHARMTMLLPELSGLASVLQALHGHAAGVPETLATRMAGVATWMRGESSTIVVPAPASVAAKSPEPGWHADLVATAEHHLATLSDLWHDCLVLQQHISDRAVDQHMPELRYEDPPSEPAYHHDHWMLLVYALTAGGATFAAGYAWILSGWIEGGAPVALAALTTCIFATTDEPQRVAWRFVRWAMVCLVVSWFYIFVVVPFAHDFAGLAGLLAVPFLIIGALIARPGFNLFAVLLSVNAASFANVQMLYDANFGNLFNGTLATFGAMIFAPLWVVTVRPFGAHAVLRRLVHASWKDIALGADRRELEEHPQLRGRMLDQLQRLVPLLAASNDKASNRGFAELQVGFGTLMLQRDFETLPPAAQGMLARVLRSLEYHYLRRVREGEPLPPPRQLAMRIDHALEAIASGGVGAASRDAVSALTNIRLSLFPNQPM
ncbi:FUSC family protein [Cupriavidus pampae]|uniref:p-hydroxybenzoic acid efflux pump subunit AaeB n=1 Tax=Cupriavidus pampae TaxID=659251 RepID=A0ABM8XD19_9BURK|nr:FUSC family protein [Cupriavidus pampae]CAG9177967.1 p-hydroxybenzoic acid efflux pump subunit AaeB [Cupriavidus pampae]